VTPDRVQSRYPGGLDPVGRWLCPEACVLLDYIVASDRFAAAAPRLRRATAA
jgi:hypothetical protein